MLWIPCLTIHLSVASSWAATAETSEEREPTSASEPEPVDPYPLLVHLHDNQDWTGLRTRALEADLANPDARYRYLAAVARVQEEPSEGLGELEALADTEVGALASLTIAGIWMDEAPRLAAAQYRAYLDANPGGAYRSYAATQEAYALATEGRFGMARTALESEGVAAPPELLMTLAAPPAWKRPFIASFLSGALPGAGQLYAGQPREAASALLVNALFISGAVYAARQEQWAALGVIGFFGIGFYTGNVYGAADAAIRYNRGMRDEVLIEMEEAGLGPQAAPLP